MKYLTTFDIEAGENKEVVTEITSEPYSVELISSTGELLNGSLLDRKVAINDDGYLTVTIYSVEALEDIKLKIIY